MTDVPYAWLGDVQTFLDTPEDDILRRLTSFARETGAPQLFAWDRTLRALRDELTTCLPDAARFALVLEFEVPRLIRKLAKGDGSRRGDARAWVNAPYAPLPALTQAARLLFER